MAEDTTNRFEGKTSLYPAPKSAMEVLHFDYFGPLQETRERYKHIFVIVDAYTRFTFYIPLKRLPPRKW